MTDGNDTGHDAGNGHAGPAAQSRNGPHFGMIPRRVATLRLPGRVHAVLDVIACHARGGWARLSLDTIANEAGIDRSKVCLCIRSLEEKRIMEVVRQRGRGLANAYRVVPDAEAVPLKGQETTAENVAVFGTEVSAQNGADCDNLSEENGAACGTVSNPKQCRARHPRIDSKEEKTPPSGESRARPREGFSSDWVNKKQRVLLLPINRRSDRTASLRRYNPSALLVDWAREAYGINAFDERVLGAFIDWHIEHDHLPRNDEAIEAAYRRWIRREPHFAQQSRHRPQQHSNAADTVVEAVRQMRAARANGADND